ncbi:uncharacterized protein ATC70_002465 [Mucor velutinosus]|uniref:Uncharacterized protein n=1 Tax=Mucor velutinosus TaxID=708070 RepID=A0AAN7DHW4_9FUNG|nr:hypothetical protein ATC70_002465 [Mucor velutinosus]
MECLETEQLLCKTFATENTKTTAITECHYHSISFAISEQGQLLAVDAALENLELGRLDLSDRVEQVVSRCLHDPAECIYYLRTSTNKVYQFSIDSSGNRHARKRAKINDECSQHTQFIELKAVASNVKHILVHHGLILISSDSAQQLTNGTLHNTSEFYTTDTSMSYHLPVQNIHTSFISFFSLPTHSGLIYGTACGAVYWRDVDSRQDALLFRMEEDEKIVFLDLLQTYSTVHTVIAFGEQGTVISYATSDQEKSGLQMRQFNMRSPLRSIDKVQDSKYIVSTGTGRVSILDVMNDKSELASIRVSRLSNVQHLRILDKENCIFETVSEQENGIEFSRIQYNNIPISIANNAEAMQQLIEDTLEELAQEEDTVKSMEIKEQALSDKLASTNRTLYALRSINDKRELGLCNSLDSTGFEFTVRPITRSNSNENCSLNTRAYLRICIKTSRFLELEGWDLSIQLFPMDSTLIGQTKMISVIGFEPHYENGIERHVIWERDIEVDLNKQQLPAKVSTTLIMTLNNTKELLFPVSELILDDIHFACPCSSHIKTSIERRGLDEISNRLMQSYRQQKLHDRTGRYPLARLLQNDQPSLLLNHRNVHVRYTVPSLSDEQYRSLLPSILGEGHSDSIKDFFHGNAEQALFTMASYPGCPVIIKLSRVSPDMIDFSIQCSYTPALFKVECILLHRIHRLYMHDTPTMDTKKLKSLEASILELQQVYQREDQQETPAALLAQLRKTIDVLYNVHYQQPIGSFTSL